MKKSMIRIFILSLVFTFSFMIMSCKNKEKDPNGDKPVSGNNDEYYQSLLDSFIPDVVEDNIELPAQKDDLYFVWRSSDQRTISNKGIVNRGRKDIVVRMSMEVILNETVGTYYKDVTVPALSFPALRQGKTVFGYYSTWHFDNYTSLQKNVDVVNLSFAYVTKNFTLDMSSIDQRIDKYLEARKYGVRVVLSVQGYGANGQNFSDAASTAENRKKLADEMLRVVEKYHFDGIDIDWEYPTYLTSRPVADKANYTLLMETIYGTFKQANPDYLVTAALPGGAYGFNRYNLKDVEPFMDYLHLMTYDLEASSNAFHHTALYTSINTATSASADASVEIYNIKGFPKSKIIMGIAFYGKYVSVPEGSNGGLRGKTTSDYKTLTYGAIYQSFLSKLGNGVTYYWDNESKAPYLYDRDRGCFVTYEDEKSIAAKCEYVRSEELGGVMIWELGEDYEDRLLQAVFKNMKITVQNYD